MHRLRTPFVHGLLGGLIGMTIAVVLCYLGTTLYQDHQTLQQVVAVIRASQQAAGVK